MSIDTEKSFDKSQHGKSSQQTRYRALLPQIVKEQLYKKKEKPTFNIILSGEKN